MRHKTYKKTVKKMLWGAVDPIMFFSGFCVISIAENECAALLNLLIRWGLKYKKVKLTVLPDTCKKIALISCSYPTYLSLLKKLNERNYSTSIKLEDGVGIPFIFKKYKYRIGIPVGIAVMSTLIIMSLCFIWDIRISGNYSVSDKEIIDTLKESGIEIGSRISSLDIDEIENQTLIKSSSISWIAINLRGTVAHIEVIEKVLPPPKEEKKPSNLVANYNGMITSLEIYSGKPMVKVGDIVSEGDLLVSGIYDSKNLGFRLRPSVGKVFAKTQREIVVEIPFEYIEKQYTGKEICENNLIFFQKTIKFSKNSGNLPQKYDTIIENRYLSVFNGENLPVYTTKTRYLEYIEVPLLRSTEDALDLAYLQLDELIYEYTKDCPLLSKKINTEIGESSIILSCRITLIENIAKSIDIDYVFN